MCYYVAHNLTQNSNNFEEKVRVLRNFVHENIHPIEGYDMSRDSTSILTLLSGIGWCDQQARAFMMLACRIGITARLTYLMTDSGASPHTVAEALDPDNRWVIVSPTFNLEILTKSGRLATQGDIKADPSILINNERIKARAIYDSNVTRPAFVSLYYNTPQYPLTKNGKRLFFLEKVPLTWLCPIVNIIQNKYFQQSKSYFKDKYEFKMLKARGYHLLGYYKRSEGIYSDIIKNSHNQHLIQKAQFYSAVILKEGGRYQQADRYLNEIIRNNPKSSYTPYLLGLRAKVLMKLGRFKEADEILRGLEYSLLFY